MIGRAVELANFWSRQRTGHELAAVDLEGNGIVLGRSTFGESLVECALECGVNRGADSARGRSRKYVRTLTGEVGVVVPPLEKPVEHTRVADLVARMLGA